MRPLGALGSNRLNSQTTNYTNHTNGGGGRQGSNSWNRHYEKHERHEMGRVGRPGSNSRDSQATDLPRGRAWFHGWHGFGGGSVLECGGKRSATPLWIEQPALYPQCALRREIGPWRETGSGFSPALSLWRDGSEGVPEEGENLVRMSELAAPGKDETTNCANDTKEGGKSIHHGGPRGPQRKTGKPEEGGAGGKGGGHPLLRPA